MLASTWLMLLWARSAWFGPPNGREDPPNRVMASERPDAEGGGLAPSDARTARAVARLDGTGQHPVDPGATPSAPTGITGRVIGPDGRPVPSIRVVADKPARDERHLRGVALGPGGGADRLHGESETGQDGRFAITGLSPGDGYGLSIGTDEWAVAHRADLEVLDDVVLDIGDVLVLRGARVGGVVRAETGAPIAGARVEIGTNWTRDPILSDERGRFDAGMLLPGITEIAVQADGWALPRAVQRDFLEGDVVLDLELTLVPAARIAGVAYDGLGRTLAGVSIEAVRTGPSAFAYVGSSERSDARGRFEFASLPPGTYRVSATKPGYRPRYASDVEAGAGPLELILDRSAVIEGTVVDAKTGRPIVAEALSLWWARPQRHRAGEPAFERYREPVDVSIRPDGSFTIGVTRAGTMRVEARAEGFAGTRSMPFEVRRNDVVPAVEVSLQRGARLAVTVLDRETRGPVTHAVVDVHHASPILGQPRSGASSTIPTSDLGVRVARGTTGRDGLVVLESMPEGAFVLRIRRDGYAPTCSGVVRVDDQSSPGSLEILLGRGGAIEGRVTGRSGDPAAAVELLVTSFAGQERRALSLESGTYRLDHLAPGRYTVEPVPGGVVRGRNGSAQPPDAVDFPVVVESGGTTRHDVVFERIEPGSLAGVLTINGLAAAGMTVIPHRFEGGRYRPRLGGELRTGTDERGRFEFRRLAPGRYALRAFRSWEDSYDCGQVTVRPSEKALAIVDVRLGIIDGIVLDPNSVPVASASVHVRRELSEDSAWDPLGGGLSGLSGPDGRFSFEVEAGSYVLSVQAAGHSPERVQGIEPSQGDETQRIEVRLKRAD
ncbi:MAG: carboxypeptidase-like regulatory domain-containing protein [Planctomycetota bacterium]